ncbi:2-oxoglutarate-dependent dioxygenase 19-like [Zingiber officinale]|uniref:2-oxoglutarate-dependent dioxygenase 19-like n=1 Tax=Zingiber officinale TaxID=94328 RepID=UPI001C4BE9BD|nr:2-oxoglutarate-dependent dioxygenase 19-like [Zingiber officinale]
MFISIMALKTIQFGNFLLCFSDVLRDYATCTRRVGMELLKGIWESLELEENDMNRALKLDSCFQVFIANLYPPCPQPELVFGLPPHSDHGLLTLLHQNGVDGLDVEHGGKWVYVKPLPGSFLVNAGDHMQIVTNGRYKSALHRAMANGKSTRVSVAMVVGPSLDTVVEPVAALVSSERPVMYRGWSYKQFLECQQGNQLKEKTMLELLQL